MTEGEVSRAADATDQSARCKAIFAAKSNAVMPTNDAESPLNG